MKYRPIIFSGAMVRALLADTKTQTRRIVKPQPFNGRSDDEVRRQMISNGALGPDESLTDLLNGAIDHGFIPEAKCPYGQPGDRLWVREAFGKVNMHSLSNNRPLFEQITYRAGKRVLASKDAPSDFDMENWPVSWVDDYKPTDGKWRPSIHMPRWASRITLEIISVRVERLRDISMQDVLAEGCMLSTSKTEPLDYQNLWESINGSGSWDANPWVWVVEFRMEAA